MTSTRTPAPKKASKKAGSRSGASDRRGTLILVGAGLAMLAILVAVVLLAGGDDQPSGGGSGEQATEVGAVDLQDDAPLPTLASTEGDEAIGLAAPRAAGVEFGGNPVTLLNPGRPAMLVFAAHWCPHCQREIPLIVEWMKEGGPTGMDVTLIATGTDRDRPNYPPSDWLAREEWSNRVVLDDQDGTLGKAYGLNGYPFIVFVDAEGKVTRRASGEIPIPTLSTWAAEAGAGT